MCHRPAGRGARRGGAAHSRHGVERAAAAACGAARHDRCPTSSSRLRSEFAKGCGISAISLRTCGAMPAAAIVDGRALFGLSVNVMPFDYGFSFAGHRATAHNLSLGPVEDLSISVYDRSRRRAAADRLRCQSGAAHAAADLAVLPATVSAAADRDRRRRSPGRQPWILDPAERDTILRRLERHRAGRPRAVTVAAVVRGAGRAHAGCRRGHFRGPRADLCGARCGSQSTGAPSAKSRRRAGNRGRAVCRALAGDADRPARHPQGRRRLSAARRRTIRASGWSSCWPTPACRCW